MKNHWSIIYLFIICHKCGLICCDDDLSQTVASQLSHPDKLGYQSVVLGTDKHRYGYQLTSSGKHFHHTSTEKDGVRLGCYGYELHGKQYMTQYVADAKGYRLVTSEDLITVYPKYGKREGKATFGHPYHFEPDESPEDVRYFFPKGCKGVDVQIDNSSRLRSMKNFGVSPKLPVTFKPVNPNAYFYNTPRPNQPGPSNIYAPNMVPVQTARPPNVYLPPEKPTNTYLPPEKPTNSYLPPQEKPDNTYLPPEKPDNTYLPPEKPDNTYLPPSTSEQPSTENPDYVDPLPEDPDNTYLPPPSPNNTYLPPDEERPPKPEEIYEIGLFPPHCPPTSDCCKDSLGKIMIPIKLKGQKSNDCCNFAKLILPLKFFEGLDFKKFKQALPKEIDTNMIVRRILENLL